MGLLVKRLAIPLMELLAIPLGYQKTAAKWLVISNQKTVAKWLVISGKLDVELTPPCPLLPKRRLTLLPRQSCRPPTADSIAVFAVVHLAFETFQHIVAVAITSFCGGCSGVVRTHPAAAKEYYQCFLVYLLFQLINEMRVGFHARIGRPFNCCGTW